MGLVGLLYTAQTDRNLFSPMMALVLICSAPLTGRDVWGFMKAEGR